MSSVPTGTLAFSMRVMILPSRSAIGTPRRRIPTNPKPSTPPFFSTISYARRTSVRSISDADISCAFWRRPVLREGAFAFIVECTSHNCISDTLPALPGAHLEPERRLLTLFNPALEVKRHASIRRQGTGGPQPLRSDLVQFLWIEIKPPRKI